MKEKKSNYLLRKIARDMIASARELTVFRRGENDTYDAVADQVVAILEDHHPDDGAAQARSLIYIGSPGLSLHSRAAMLERLSHCFISRRNMDPLKKKRDRERRIYKYLYVRTVTIKKLATMLSRIPLEWEYDMGGEYIRLIFPPFTIEGSRRINSDTLVIGINMKHMLASGRLVLHITGGCKGLPDKNGNPYIYPHPHMKGDLICAGKMQDALNYATRTHDILSFIDIIESMKGQYRQRDSFWVNSNDKAVL